MAGFQAVGVFLVGILFNLAITIFWFRIFLRYFRVSALHPISMSINNLTNSWMQPIERSIYGRTSFPPRYDIVSVGVILILEIIKFSLLALLTYGQMLPAPLLALFVIADFIIQPCDLFFYMILIRVICSWINPRMSNPALDILVLITEPLLRWGRRIVPDISGFDFSPYLIIVLLKVITLFITASMPLNLL